MTYSVVVAGNSPSLFRNASGSIEVLEWSKLYSIEFCTGSKTKAMCIRFLKGAHLTDVEMCTTPADIQVVKGELNLIWKLQSAVGTRAEILFCRGCHADVLKTLDEDRDRKGGIHYPFFVKPIENRKLIFYPSHKVLGRYRHVFTVANFVAYCQWTFGRALATIYVLLSICKSRWGQINL